MSTILGIPTVALLIISFAVGMPGVHAEPSFLSFGFVDFNPIWEIKKAVQEVEMFLSIDKDTTRLKHLTSAQAEKEHFIENNDAVPSYIEQRIEEKQKPFTESKSPISDLITSVRKGGELLIIKGYANEFQAIRTDCIKDNSILTDCLDKINTLESKVNNLLLVKENCNHNIDVDTLVLAKDPYAKLQQDYCPVLESVSSERAREVISNAD